MPGAVGTPSPNAEVAIMDADGQLAAAGPGPARSSIAGPQVMTEYLRDPAATEAAFEHGWFHSGDCGHFDADGILWFEDRFKDVIKTGGENVASIEVEKALYAADPGRAGDRRGRPAARALGRGGDGGRRREGGAQARAKAICSKRCAHRSARSNARSASCSPRRCRRPRPAKSRRASFGPCSRRPTKRDRATRLHWRRVRSNILSGGVWSVCAGARRSGGRPMMPSNRRRERQIDRCEEG